MASAKALSRSFAIHQRRCRNHTIFSFDDLFFVPASAAGGHIRAVREGDWTYAVYFGLDGAGLEYELYNLKSDPGQHDQSGARQPDAGHEARMGPPCIRF
jgi:hypothetical protein